MSYEVPFLSRLFVFVICDNSAISLKHIKTLPLEISDAPKQFKTI